MCSDTSQSISLMPTSVSPPRVEFVDLKKPIEGNQPCSCPYLVWRIEELVVPLSIDNCKLAICLCFQSRHRADSKPHDRPFGRLPASISWCAYQVAVYCGCGCSWNTIGSRGGVRQLFAGTLYITTVHCSVWLYSCMMTRSATYTRKLR
jgi:hypothetical protein